MGWRMAAKTGRTAQLGGNNTEEKAVSCIPDNMDIIQTARELCVLSVYLLGHFFVTLYNESVLMRFLSVWSQYSLDSYVTILHMLSRENPLNNLVHYTVFMCTNSLAFSRGVYLSLSLIHNRPQFRLARYITTIKEAIPFKKQYQDMQFFSHLPRIHLGVKVLLSMVLKAFSPLPCINSGLWLCITY